MQPSHRDMMLENIRRKYPTYNALAEVYSSSLQGLLLDDMEKAYSEKSPTLSDIGRMYHPVAPALWVKTQLTALDLVTQTKEGANANALQEFSELFVRQYPYIKLTEFLLFIARFKMGRYGKFYGYFDTMTIGEAFRKFMRERGEETDVVIRSRMNRDRENATCTVERNHVMPEDLAMRLGLKKK